MKYLFLTFFLSPSLLAQDSLILRAGQEISSAHSTVSEKLVDISKDIDDLLGDQTGEYPSPKTQATILFASNTIGNEDTVNETKIRLKLALPRTQKKFHLIVKNLNDEVNSSELFNPNRETKDNNSYSTSLRYFFTHNDNFSVHLDGGVLLKDPLDPFVKLRSEQNYKSNPWNIKFNEQIAHYESTGYSFNAGATFTRFLASNYWLKQTNLASWEEEDNYFQFFNELSFIYKLKKNKSVTYFVRSLGFDEPVTHMDSYDYGVTFKTPVGWDWMTFKVSPYMNHQKQYEFKSNTAISMGLEILMGAT